MCFKCNIWFNYITLFPYSNNIFIQFEKELFLFSYPGIMANDLDDLLFSEYLPPPSRVGTVIVHVGANNASTERENQTIQTASKNVCNCIDTLVHGW